ncbi:hypothetical protein [Actinoplanes sp. NPDC023714]|uniref:hypothetical protein n=1 Tax=Actinoplanes sp. NPDC023714 TaxID=3154322 RepID=UPI0033DECED4
MLFDHVLDRAWEQHGESAEYDELESRYRWREALIWLAAIVAAIGVGWLVRDPLVVVARALTGGIAPLMAVAGWVIALAPFVAFGLCLWREGRARPIWAGVTVLLGGVLFWFVPLSGAYIVRVVGGLGGAGFITGLYLGTGTAAVAALLTPFVLAIVRADQVQGTVALAAIGAIASLAFAMVHAW